MNVCAARRAKFEYFDHTVDREGLRAAPAGGDAMAVADAGGMSPVEAFALVGALGVGAQWIAWRLRLPAIVVMLGVGLLIGPVLGVFDPMRDIGAVVPALISLAVAVILFEGGMTLELHKLGDARQGVVRLVVIGAPLGWLMSACALHFGAGLGWEASAVFGGIMVVTGPTVIAPLLRSAGLARRPANLLQWEAIVNDPVGALAAVLAFEFVLVARAAESLGAAVWTVALGVIVAGVIGYAAGAGIAAAFKRALVPEYMKVPVLFVVMLVAFAVPDMVLHESGLLSVTVMGLVIANANLPSYIELRRFKEHATILLVSGVFILLAASMDFATLGTLDWRAGVFVALVVLVARPVTVLASLIGTKIPPKERALIAFTGPRGVVLVAVAGLFGERLQAAGIEDGAVIGPLAFVLVLATVVLHGFTLAPVARLLGLAATGTPGVLLLGGSRFTTALGEALVREAVPVLVVDPNHARLHRPRVSGLDVFYGDVLGEAAEHSLEILSYKTLIAATENDAYNTLVATDLGPEFGRDQVWQIAASHGEKPRHALPAQLGGRGFGAGKTYRELETFVGEGWKVSVTGLSEAYGFEDWRAARPHALHLGQIAADGSFARASSRATPKGGEKLVSLMPPEPVQQTA